MTNDFYTEAENLDSYIRTYLRSYSGMNSVNFMLEMLQIDSDDFKSKCNGDIARYNEIRMRLIFLIKKSLFSYDKVVGDHFDEFGYPFKAEYFMLDIWQLCKEFLKLKKNGIVLIDYSHFMSILGQYQEFKLACLIANSDDTILYYRDRTMAGISSKALEFGNPQNKKKYQQYEFNSDFDLNLYESFYRTHDPQIGRFLQIDPKPTDWESPYVAMGNNPVLKTDFLGDTTRVGDSRNQTLTDNSGKTYKGADLTKEMIKEWETIGGVKLKVDKKTGEVKFKGYNNKGGFSKTGRDEIMKMVTGNGQVQIDFATNMSSQTIGNNIYLNPTEIDKMVNGTSSDLNSITASYGMVGIHEYGHTNVGGGLLHDNFTITKFGVIDQLDVAGNQIRSEMSAATGSNWGQRESYRMMSVYGSLYLPFSVGAEVQLRRAKAFEGTTQGYITYPPPTTSVIKIPPL